MVVQVARDGAHARRVEHGAAALGWDVGEKRNNEETLLRRVEVVDKEVAVDVPALEGLGRVGFVLVGWGAEVDNEGVAPLLGGWLDAVLWQKNSE